MADWHKFELELLDLPTEEQLLRLEKICDDYDFPYILRTSAKEYYGTWRGR